jgi:transcription-repair coupling factor (superfamily II helicase)
MDRLLPAGAGWQEVAQALGRGRREVVLHGLTPAAAAYVLSRLFGALSRPFLLVCPDAESAELFLKDLAFFQPHAGDTPPSPWSRWRLFPAHEVLPFRTLGPDAEVGAARLAAAYVALTSRDPFFLVAPAAALQEKLPPREALKEAWLYLVAGEELNRREFLARLVSGGYARRPLVEDRGEFSVRGGNRGPVPSPL